MSNDKRDVRLNVRLSSEMMAKVDQVAERMGLAGATVGAIAIAEYVNSKAVQRELMEMIADRTAAKGMEAMERMMADPAQLALMASAAETA